MVYLMIVFFQAEDGIRDLVRSRGLGDVYKRQVYQDANTIYGKPQFIFYHAQYSHIDVL